MKNNYWKTLLTNAGAALLSMLIPSRRRKPRAPAAAKRAKYDAIEELKKRMIANQELPARVYEATPEEAELLERLSAPTLRDLRGATKDLMAAISVEPDSASPNGRHPQQAARKTARGRGYGDARTPNQTVNPRAMAGFAGTTGGPLVYVGVAGRSRRRISTRLRRQTLGAEHVDVAASLHHRAGWAYQKGDFAGSETLYREALALRRKLPGAEHPDIAPSPANLASALQDIGHSRAEHFSCFGRQRPADRPEPLHDSQSKESFRDRQFALLFSHV